MRDLETRWNRGETRPYQDSIVPGPDIQIDRPDAYSDNNVDHEPEPVIPKVSRHVDERTLGQGEGLLQETRLAPSRIQHGSFLQKKNFFPGNLSSQSELKKHGGDTTRNFRWKQYSRFSISPRLFPGPGSCAAMSGRNLLGLLWLLWCLSALEGHQYPQTAGKLHFKLSADWKQKNLGAKLN